MKTYGKMLLGVLLIAAIGISFFTMHFANAQSDPIESKLQAANIAVGQAFSSVGDAESAGANVTGLLAQLNVADSILAQAENSYRGGDFNTAGVKADSVLPIAQEVTGSAQAAKQAALVSGQNALWSLIAFTVFGAFVFVLVLFQFWRWFRQRYIKNLSDAKLEVNS